jgi:sporulation protein YlmC with PRC-barrel domain
MKIRNSNPAPWLAAFLCLCLTSATKADDAADKTKAATTQNPGSTSELTQEYMPQHEALADSFPVTASESYPSESTPTRANKASGILGMKVRNQNKHYLGYIKDLVIDWTNEQVSYAVLSTGGRPPFGGGGKLLAVPFTALTVSPDQKHLILNADKDAVAAAKGFDEKNWPSVSQPSWGAQPFLREAPAAPSQPKQPAKESESEEERIPISDLGMR